MKLATMMGMGRVMHSTPQIAHSDATNLPAGVLQVQTTFILAFDVSPYDLTIPRLECDHAAATHRGAMSPYPVLVMVMMAQYSVCSNNVLPRDT